MSAVSASSAEWLTVGVTAVAGWVNVFAADGGRRVAMASPALLQQRSIGNGRNRVVFAAVARSGELVAAPDAAGYVETIMASDWKLFGGGR